MKTIEPAKALIIAGVAALGLSGGVAAAALLPPGGPAGIAQALDQTVGQVLMRGPGHAGGFLSAAATYIGISEDQLRSELGTDKSLADVAIAHGKTRDGLIAALVAAEQKEITQLVDQKGLGARRGPGGPGRPGPGAPFGMMGDQLSAASTYLGINSSDLREKLRNGQSLAQIAAATPGKSRDGLIQALVTDAKTKIAAAQQSGRLTADQATRLTNDLQDRITRLVDATRPPFGPGGRPNR